jgi:hypothetical protein
MKKFLLGKMDSLNLKKEMLNKSYEETFGKKKRNFIVRNRKNCGNLIEKCNELLNNKSFL